MRVTMKVPSRLESTLSKEEILELYLNSAYLGRGSWGVEMAARSYFGKSAKDITLAEGAMLASLLKGPSFFNPDRHPERAKDRLAYVLGRMQEDGSISTEQKEKALATPPKLVASDRHDWIGDPFSRGTWATATVGRAELLSAERFPPFGRIAFATADVAAEEAGWIEGALRAGAAAARWAAGDP